MKICSKCKKEKDLKEYWNNNANKDGLYHYCKDCTREMARNRMRLKGEVGRKVSREYQREKRKDPIFRLKQNKRSQEKRKRIRLEVLQYYAGIYPRCACCGESHYEFLGIDHINNDGAKHRKEIGATIYGWLKKNNFPEGFQVLCHNCNLAKGFYGRCPHILKSSIKVEQLTTI
jgi:hypothetical protein|tara:strand:- start:15673 stop:16194 length:522 start_codon:yes stop_codon:yes gene_type:complete